MADKLFSEMSPDYIVYVATIGVCLGMLSLMVFIYHRLRRLLSAFSNRQYTTPKALASIRNFILIILWSAVFGMLLFLGYFLRAYHVFTLEKPVASIEITPMNQPQTMKIQLVRIDADTGSSPEEFIIKGDQWALEGDILKWDNWLNFLGLQTRYRFTRIRGRYLEAKDEIRKENTIHSLVRDEDHYFWQYLYQYGEKLPFVSTVYGNAVFQYGNRKKDFLIYVSNSGFIIREASAAR